MAPVTNLDGPPYAGKVATVTGGASGMGEAISRRLIAEGASVVAGDVNQERLALLGRELGERYVGVPTDVRVESDCEAMVATAVERFGALHVAFNAAGAPGGAAIVDLDEEQWDTTVDVCLKGVFLAMKHELRQLYALGEGGAIVNIASLNSEVPNIGATAYCAAKAGVVMATECAAIEAAERGVRVNAVSPGLTDTPLAAPLFQVPGLIDAFLDRIPLKRLASPEDIAAAALFLASEDAGFVSGVNLFVDGAWALTAYPDTRAIRARAALS